MYKIRGGDGKEYGPVSADTLKQWVAEGRANAQTQVQPEGSMNWVALGQLPEFAEPADTAPTPPSFAATAGAPNIASLVSGPAIGLIVTAVLGALMQLVGIAGNILGTGLGLAAQSEGHQELPAWVHMMSGGVGIVFNVLGIIMSGVILMGALKMKALEKHGFAMVATIIAMVPCISPCCFVGLPIGIWALVILNKPEVKAAFRS